MKRAHFLMRVTVKLTFPVLGAQVSEGRETLFVPAVVFPVV